MFNNACVCVFLCVIDLEISLKTVPSPFPYNREHKPLEAALCMA